MSHQGPRTYPFRYMLSGVPAAGNDRYMLGRIADAKEYAAVELSPASELDCCIVEHSGGRISYVAAGSPAVGPFEGPLLIRPWRRILPFSNDGQGFTAQPLVANPPLLVLIVHSCMPSVFAARRAPIYRGAADVLSTDSFASSAEFPLYGYSHGRVQLINIGANSLTYRVQGTQYDAKVGELEGDPFGYDAAPVRMELVLDGTGALTRAIAAGAQDSITVDDEPFDTLIVQIKATTPGSQSTMQHRYAAQEGG